MEATSSHLSVRSSLGPLSNEGHQQRYFLEKLCHGDLILCGFGTEPRVTGVRLLGKLCRRQVQSQHNQVGSALHIGVIVSCEGLKIICLLCPSKKSCYQRGAFSLRKQGYMYHFLV